MRGGKPREEVRARVVLCHGGRPDSHSLPGADRQREGQGKGEGKTSQRSKTEELNTV